MVEAAHSGDATAPANPRPAAFLILHGWENHREREHWQHWLTYELLGADALVSYPTLPSPDAPLVDDWLDTLEEQIRRLQSHDLTVVCHSLACSLWVTYINAGRPSPGVSRVALVSPPSPRALRSTAVAPFIKGHTRLVSPPDQSWIVFNSDNDPYCPEGFTFAFQVDDNIQVRVLPAAEHINPASGFGHWPEILDWCLDRV